MIAKAVSFSFQKYIFILYLEAAMLVCNKEGPSEYQNKVKGTSQSGNGIKDYLWTEKQDYLYM